MLATAGEGITLRMAVPSAEAVPLSRSDSIVSSLQRTFLWASEMTLWILKGDLFDTPSNSLRMIIPCLKCPLVLSITVIPERVIIFWLYWHKVPHSGIFQTVISPFYFLHFIQKLSLEKCKSDFITSLWSAPFNGSHCAYNKHPTPWQIKISCPGHLRGFISCHLTFFAFCLKILIMSFSPQGLCNIVPSAPTSSAIPHHTHAPLAPALILA